MFEPIGCCNSGLFQKKNVVLSRRFLLMVLEDFPVCFSCFLLKLKTSAFFVEALNLHLGCGSCRSDVFGTKSRIPRQHHCCGPKSLQKMEKKRTHT